MRRDAEGARTPTTPLGEQHCRGRAVSCIDAASTLHYLLHMSWWLQVASRPPGALGQHVAGARLEAVSGRRHFRSHPDAGVWENADADSGYVCPHLPVITSRPRVSLGSHLLLVHADAGLRRHRRPPDGVRVRADFSGEHRFIYAFELWSRVPTACPALPPPCALQVLGMPIPPDVLFGLYCVHWVVFGGTWLLHMFLGRYNKVGSSASWPCRSLAAAYAVIALA